MAASRYVAIAVVLLVILVGAAYFLTRAPGGEEVETTTTTTPAATVTGTTPTATAPKEITIKIGVLVDETGPTSDVGVSYAQGVIAALKYFNEKGIYTKDGVRVKLEWIKRDYAYNPTRAEEYYKEFRDKYNVIAVLGWGTADTEKLSDTIIRDKIVYISASYSAKLSVKPFNFYVPPDYSTQACIAINWVAKTKPGAKLALLYDTKVAYSRSPIDAIKQAAQKLGLQVVAEIDLPLKATEADADRVILTLIEKTGGDVDYVWCGNTITSCSLAAKAMAKHGLKAVMITNVWGFDERSKDLIGQEGFGKVMGVSPFIYPIIAKQQGVEGITMVYEAARAAGIPESDVNLRFLQGFLSAWLLVQAIERTTSQDLLTKGGEALKTVLESSCQGEPFDFKGLVAPARFCPGYHVPSKQAYLVLLDENGNFKLIGPEKAPEGIDCAMITAKGGG